ncbi:MAG: hypothetical protein RIR52_2125, partial [Acidobacteriota bacterium]
TLVSIIGLIIFLRHHTKKKKSGGSSDNHKGAGLTPGTPKPELDIQL